MDLVCIIALLIAVASIAQSMWNYRFHKRNLKKLKALDDKQRLRYIAITSRRN